MELFCRFEGGASDPERVMDLTRGHFDANLNGCVRNVVVMGQDVDPAEAAENAVSGMNVHDCSESDDDATD